MHPVIIYTCELYSLCYAVVVLCGGGGVRGSCGG